MTLEKQVNKIYNPIEHSFGEAINIIEFTHDKV